MQVDLFTLLVIGNFAFTAGCYGFVWNIYRILSTQLNNHFRTELREMHEEIAHVRHRCRSNCAHCVQEVHTRVQDERDE